MWARALDARCAVGSKLPDGVNYLDYLSLNAFTIVSNLTSATRVMSVIVRLGVYMIVPFMKTVALVVAMLVTAMKGDLGKLENASLPTTQLSRRGGAEELLSRAARLGLL